MYFKFNIQTESSVFQPTMMEVYISEETEVIDGEDHTSIEAVYTELINNGKIVKTVTTALPTSSLQAMIDGFDLKSGQPIVSTPVLNAYLAQFNIQII